MASAGPLPGHWEHTIWPLVARSCVPAVDLCQASGGPQLGQWWPYCQAIGGPQFGQWWPTTCPAVTRCQAIGSPQFSQWWPTAWPVVNQILTSEGSPACPMVAHCLAPAWPVVDHCLVHCLAFTLCLAKGRPGVDPLPITANLPSPISTNLSSGFSKYCPIIFNSLPSPVLITYV